MVKKTTKAREGLERVELPELIRPEGVNLATLLDKPVGVVRDALEQSDVGCIFLEPLIDGRVEAEAEIAGLNDDLQSVRKALQSKRDNLPSVFAGDRVVVYTMGDKAVGFGRYDAPEKIEPKQTRSGRRKKSSSRSE